jgi:polyhydroxyalkanoate depolymerase
MGVIPFVRRPGRSSGLAFSWRSTVENPAITAPVTLMMYLAYQAQADFMQPLRVLAQSTAAMLRQAHLGTAPGTAARRIAAACELIARAGLSHRRPSFRIDKVVVGGREMPVREEAVHTTPFGTLLRFAKDIDIAQPRVLLVAPLSGHFATLLRGTVQTLLPEHDVYITDWHNARDVGVWHGRFGFDEYVDHLITFLEVMGAGAHMIAVCQPCVQALAATAVMAETGNPAQPRSLTLMAGPIDCRVNPTAVNQLATSRPIQWFERNLISPVPVAFPGASCSCWPS